jgi:hypothetical protein
LIIHSQLTFNLSTSKHRRPTLPFPSLPFRPLRSEGTQPLQMAGSSTKGSSKSPKKTRQGKAAASEIESASKSSKKTRKRKGKATVSEMGLDDFNNEDYNIRSRERTRLLTKMKGVINNAPVSPTLWACCQLSDMNCLQDFAKTSRQMILVYQDSLAFIAVQCELLEF